MTRSLRENLVEEEEEDDEDRLELDGWLEEEDWEEEEELDGWEEEEAGIDEDWVAEEEESAQPSPGAVVEVSLLLQTPSLLLKQLNNILEV